MEYNNEPAPYKSINDLEKENIELKKNMKFLLEKINKIEEDSKQEKEDMMRQDNLRTLLKSKEMPPKYDSTVWHIREVPSTYLPEYEWFAELIKESGPEAWCNFSSAIKKDDNIIDFLKNIIYFFKHKL